MNDKLLVRLMDYDKDDCMIEAYYTTNWSEPLKMYSFMKENNLPYMLTIGRGEKNKDYFDKEFIIKDIELTFGGEDTLNVLNIYVEVI